LIHAPRHRRLVIDPNKWWGGDMTRIDTFTIKRVK